MTKEYLKMADVFEQLKEPNPENEIAFDLNHGYLTVLACEYAAHAINSHDELVAEVERLRSLTEKAFIDGCEAGFALSAEGVNGEYSVVSYESMTDRFKAAIEEYKNAQ